MKPIISKAEVWRPLALGFCLLAGTLASAGGAVAWSYEDLVGTLTNLERLAELPGVGETSAEWTSRDRASTYDSGAAQYLNWQANNDGTGCVRVQPDGGIVMAEMSGPGCIWRIWSAQAGAGHVQIWLDGSNAPAVDLAFQDFFNRTCPPFTYPGLVYTVCGGLDSYVPIPYNRSCKVVAYGAWGQYFHFNYSTFPSGVTVPTFGTNLTAAQMGALSNVNNFFQNHLGSDPAGGRSGEVTVTNVYSVGPGQSAVALDYEGQGAIAGFKVHIPGLSGARDTWAALRELGVSMAWDGETNSSVWAPLGDFFGSACGYVPYTALPLGMQSNGWMYCYWYMPFASRAQINFENAGGVARQVEVVITRAPLAKPINALARFHAKWNRGVYVTGNGRSPDYRFLTAKGPGRFVGLAMHVYQTVDLSPGPWWGEGDEKFFVDGESMPSWFGTGSEDYFGFAWGTPGYFSKAYHSQLLSPPGNLYAPGNRALNRFQITDNTPFQTSFEGCIEKWQYTNDSVTRFALLPYWYSASGSSDPYSALSLTARTNYYLPDYAFAWTNAGGGLWGAPANWANAAVADGAGLGADFGALDLASNITIHLDSARTLGRIVFDDLDPGSSGGWTLDDSGAAANFLTLTGGYPAITVNTLGAGAAAAINAGIVATNDLTKSGSGMLTVGGANTFAGLIVNGGTLTVTGKSTIAGNGATHFFLGNADPGYDGTLDIENGATVAVTGTFADNFVIGRDGGSGTVVQNGGNFSYNPANASYLFVGASSLAATRSAYKMNGGLLNLNGKILSVGFGNGVVVTGAVSQVGGVITNVGTLALPGLGTSGFGQYTLSGGSLYIGAGGITSTSGKYDIQLRGGTVAASASWASSLDMKLTGANSAVTFNTAANTVTLSGALSGGGGLTKAGSGTLVLSGVLSYGGDTTINAGFLQLNRTSQGHGAVRLASGARLRLNFVGTNFVGGLFTNNVALPSGAYDASNLPGFILGSGVLNAGDANGQASGITVTNGVASITFEGISNYRYHVQVSTNLNNWSDVWITNAPAEGVFQFSDNAAWLQAAYYRLMWNGN